MVIFSLGRFVPSQADTAVYEALAGAPQSDTPHALRWYNHIKSFAAGMKQFPKASKASYEFTSSGEAAAAELEENDDLDLFGSEDEEESEEKKRITEEASGGKQPSLPDFSEQEAVQRFFLQEVQLGEELLATGDIQNGVEHLSLAVAVCGQPHSLLSVLQQTLPPQVNIDPGIIKNIFNLGR